MRAFLRRVNRGARSLVLAPVRFYRKHLSAQKKAPCCRFLPTCSQYCLEAVEEWGIIIGLALSLWRILRCNPLCKGGYDPVPQRKRKERIKKEK